MREFHQAVDGEPDFLDAHAFDAAVLVRSILASSQPPRTRDAFRQALTEARDVPGVCGMMSMGPDRRVLKRIQVFTVRKGRFSPLYGPDALPGEPEPDKPAEPARGRRAGVPCPRKRLRPSSKRPRRHRPPASCAEGKTPPPQGCAMPKAARSGGGIGQGVLGPGLTEAFQPEQANCRNGRRAGPFRRDRSRNG